MRDRLPALDGLRGFAAFSVLLSHIGLGAFSLSSFSALALLVAAFSGGHTAVQILFVLSGFLMAYLYPEVSSAKIFLQKRYARIFPIYGTIVVFLWLTGWVLKTRIWFVQVVMLLILAGCVHGIWKFLKNHSRIKHIGSILFYFFVIFQTTILLFNLVITPKHDVTGMLNFSEPVRGFLTMVTNLTLSTPFVKGIENLSGVFWSLGAEVLFYILYPFIVIPLLRLAKKNHWIITVFIIIGITKILLDLDHAAQSVLALQSMNIARMNGFVAGVTIGSIYQIRGRLWQSIEKIMKLPIMSFFALLLLFIVQIAEAITGTRSIEFMNYLYLLASWLIGIVVFSALIPQTLVHKIFKLNYITFLGLISYSLYLIHLQTAEWTGIIVNYLSPFLHNTTLLRDIFIILAIPITILISYLLFQLVESLYFSNKKNVIATTQASFTEKTEKKGGKVSKVQFAFIVCSVLFILSLIYSGLYSSSLLVYKGNFRHSNVPLDTDFSLLHNNAHVTFTSSNNNFSVVGFTLRYGGSAGVTIVKKKVPAMLQFQLLGQNKHVLFTSLQHAYQVEGSPKFQFGFPTIRQTKGKTYTVRLSLIGGTENDQVFLITSPESFIQIYSPGKKILLHNPLLFIINRLEFIFTNMNYVFALIYILFIFVMWNKNLLVKPARK